MTTSSFHVPVLLQEILDFLNPLVGEVFVDCTLGGGGHAEAILEKVGLSGKLIGIDQDLEAIAASKKRLGRFTNQVVFIQDNFVSLETILKNLGIIEVNGILFDLGVSSYQLETPERGFSFGERGQDAPLDMRMNSTQSIRAYDIVNFYPEVRLEKILFTLGEEPFGRKIAKEIVVERGKKPLATCGELLEVIKKALPPHYRFSRKHGHWASKVFRALRMEVNQELSVLEAVLPQAFNVLKNGGRLAILSFHSLEDRIVKQRFREWEQAGLVEILTPKPIMASPQEIEANPRADSAKLRAVKKITASQEFS